MHAPTRAGCFEPVQEAGGRHSDTQWQISDTGRGGLHPLDSLPGPGIVAASGGELPKVAIFPNLSSCSVEWRAVCLV